MGDADLFKQAQDCQRAGEWREAATLLGQVLKSRPDHVDALHQLARIEMRAGASESAVNRLRQAQSADPDDAALNHDLGMALCQLGQPDSALPHMRKAARLAPEEPGFLNNLGALEEQMGDLDEAIRWFRRAAELMPANAVPHFNLGEALLKSGDADGAVPVLRVAATLDPTLHKAWLMLGRTLMDQGAADQAVGPLRRAVELRSDDAGSHHALADALQFVGQLDAAIQSYKRSLECDDGNGDAWYGLGHAQLEIKRPVAAASSLEQCLKLNPEDGRAHNDLGKALHQFGRIELAMPHLRRAASLGPSEVTETALQSIAVMVPGNPLDNNQTILEARREWGRMLRGTRGRQVQMAGRSLETDRLRIGYVSSFFRHRNWMKPVWALINHHDRDRFDIHLISDAPESEIDEGYRRHPADRVHYIGGRPNESAARLIAGAGIDILVDLNGYSAPQRFGLFTYRPATVIVAWFGMYGTTGLDDFDYLVGDDHVIPPEEEPFYSERILRVPGSYLTFEVTYPVPDVTPPPCLERGAITFGSLASQYKINDDLVETWATILDRCNDSRLVLRNASLGDEEIRANLADRFAAHHIPSDRLELEGPAEHRTFLRTYERIDIALDSFPYTGATTTTEAIWQGVPVVTVDNDRWASRTSASILNTAGLSEFVAGDSNSYIEKCVALAQAADTPDCLRDLRAGMRDRLRASQACDVEAFAGSMEALYRDIAKR